MKVLHTIPGLSISSGGPSTCTYYLLKGLREAKADADILTLLPKNPNDQIIGNDDFIKAFPRDTFTPLAYSRNIRKYLKTYTRYDLYHANALWIDSTHATLKYALKQNKPCIVAPHGMLYPQALQVSAWKKKIASFLFQRRDLERATCIQATCSQELQYIRDYGLINPVALVPNCLNIDYIDYSIPATTRNTKKRFGFVGRLHRIKNIDGLMCAWAKLKNITKDAELVIVGNGDDIYKNELHQYAIENRISNVLFAGFLTGEKLSEMIRTFDYLILPSHSENFGMVVPEALIMGVPVIASTGTPWEELNTHHCGWWVDNDVDTLATTLEIAINTPEEERKRMGENGRKLTIENYSVGTISGKMIQLYKWILGGGEKPDFVYIN